MSANSTLLQGKTALITGANGGIGRAVAEAYSQAGANCLLSDIQSQSQHPELARSLYVQSDVSELAAIERLCAACAQRFDGVDLLFNNAAVFDMAPLLESDLAMYERIFAVNVKGMFFTMQQVARMMVSQARGGKIINLASQAGRRGEALVSHYCASKAAVISYTQSAALALAEQRINVNAIAPGVVDTPMWGQVDALFARYEGLQPGEKKRQVGQAVPWGRMGKPQDIVGAALFLASPGSEYVTGQTLNVDGGNVLN